MINVIVWDLETIPDLRGYAAANAHVGRTDDHFLAATATSSPSTTGRTAIPGPSMRLAPHMLATALKRR